MAKGVRFPPAPQRKSLAGKAKVAQELPSYPSSAVTRGQPGEKASTGTREYVSYTKNTKQMILTDIKAVRLRAPGQVYY